MPEKEDMEKARRLWQSMNELLGEEKPFPTETLTSFMEAEAERIANEPPGTLTLCNNCGQYEELVDMWGLCPFCRR